jgi:hypothetical protein
LFIKIAVDLTARVNIQIHIIIIIIIIIIIAVVKKGSDSIVPNYKPVSIINNFLKFVKLYYILLYFLSTELNSSRHGFRIHNSTSTSLVAYLNTVVPSVSARGQTDSVYFDLSNAFHIVPYNLLLRKFTNFILSSGYVSWFHIYLTSRQSPVRIFGTLSFSYVVKFGVPQGFTLGPLLLIYSLLIFVILNTSCLGMI